VCGLTACLAARPGGEADAAWVRSATALLAHRGPDDWALFTEAGVALGVRRLAIRDRTPAGHQPMRSADGRFWIAFNGEI
jgi:asparagine synthase (glutamine-hydrolysing)